MKYLKFILLLAALALVLVPVLLPGEAPGGEYSPGSEDLSGVDSILLTNCHNGNKTLLTDPETIASVTAFLMDTVGSHPESGKGYYEGSFSLELFRGESRILSLAYGDSDCFYTGKGSDGYPLRYPLMGMTVKEDVIPFFSALEGEDNAGKLPLSLPETGLFLQLPIAFSGEISYTEFIEPCFSCVLSVKIGKQQFWEVKNVSGHQRNPSDL